MFKDDPAKRLTRSEERVRRAEAALDDLDEGYVSAVGVAVPSDGGRPVPIFFCMGRPYMAVALVEGVLAKDNEYEDVSDLLTALYQGLLEREIEGSMVAGHIPRCDGALLVDPQADTVSLYRPNESVAPLGSWSCQEWLHVQGLMEEGQTDEAWQAAHERNRAFLDLMQPGHRAAWEEFDAAENERADAADAIKSVPRHRLKAVPTS